MWFSAVTHAVNCRNATSGFKKQSDTTPHEKVFGVKKDVSKFRPFGCRAYMHLNKERREKGKHVPKAVEVIHLGFASDLNTSGYKFLIEGTGKIIVSNQGKFDEGFFPYSNCKMIDNHIDHITSLDILSPEPGQYRFIKFDPSINLDDFEKIHSGGSSGSYLLRSIAHPNVCMRVEREGFFRSHLQKRSDELLINALVLVSQSRAPGGG